MMKKCFAVISLLASFSASASVGVAFGSENWAKDNMPLLGKKEQVKVFVCHGKTKEMPGAMAESCALEKCKRYFKVPLSEKEPSSEKPVGGHCKRDGWSEMTNAFNVAAVGKPGDNRFMMTKSLGEKTMESTMKWLKSADFPLDESLIAFNIFDTGDNGKDTPESAFPERQGKGKGSSAPALPGSSKATTNAWDVKEKR